LFCGIFLRVTGARWKPLREVYEKTFIISPPIWDHCHLLMSFACVSNHGTKRKNMNLSVHNGDRLFIWSDKVQFVLCQPWWSSSHAPGPIWNRAAKARRLLTYIFTSSGAHARRERSFTRSGYHDPKR
jgi:hypothetical protein